MKVGDLTPFELIIQRQEELAKSRQQQKVKIASSSHEKEVTKQQHTRFVQQQIDFVRRKRIERKEELLQKEAASDDSYEEEDGEYSTSGTSEDHSDSDASGNEQSRRGQGKSQCHRRKGKATDARTLRMSKDDGDEKHFLERIQQYKSAQNVARIDGSPEFDDPNGFQELKDEFRISNHCWNKLYKYQKTGVRWLYELHSQCVGGILADEMGLGKTIQICVFLRSLAESHKKSQIFKYRGLGPSLIVCPATVLHQWVKELNQWFPLAKVAVLHSSGAHSGSKSRLIQRMSENRNDGTILVTSYSTYNIEHKKLLNMNWHYVILDEGHKIRNPNAKVTLTLKELRTPHRIILSGSPLQNNLKELWSLIDFIYPGRLGSLKEFVEKFSIPITQGGYANATAIQVRTAYKCACVLRDAINPYLLRRMKKDVQMVLQLPEKTEQILFCDITGEQRRIYQEYLESKTCNDIIAGSQMPFAALIFLRKLCNHPDLVTGGPNRFGDLDVKSQPELEYGACQRSGKLVVVQTLLRLWAEQGQKVLLFSQSRQMLSIIERLLIVEGYNYLRMDGTTAIGRRQGLVTSFNTDKNIFIFLLTTKVGGLGINLTGANRVLIYDPDWNPSTDTQARERAWRIGQNRDVTIYRLLTSGTIEEKIYQRQIFKHFLANRILVNPKQQRFFKTNDLYELFTLGDAKSDRKHGTETSVIFPNVRTEKGGTSRQKKRKAGSGNATAAAGKFVESPLDDSLKELEKMEDDSAAACELSDETKQRLQRLAKKYAANFDKTAKPAASGESKDGASKDSNKTQKKKTKSTLFDGKYEVPMLKRQTGIQKQQEEDNGTGISSKEQDDYVLNKLLKKKVGGIHSALPHDQIMRDGAAVDIQLIEDEANVVAKRAADVLKRSRRAHQLFLERTAQFNGLVPKKPEHSVFGRKRAVEFVEVEETGESGKRSRADSTENNESEREFDGSDLLKTKSVASGADLLSSIRQRKERQLDISILQSEDDEEEEEIRDYPSLSAHASTSSTSFGDRHEKLAEEIRNFICVNNGSARTEEILSRFKNEVQPTDAFVFRSILKNLCKLKPNSQWVLKDEFA